MDKYELIMIVDAALSDQDKETALKETTDVLSKSGGKVINNQVWLDKHKMTFPMRKCTHGTYYSINFEGPASVVAKTRPILKMNERILRFLSVKAAI